MLLIQNYISENSDEVYHFISKELNVNSNICDLLEKYFEILGNYEKLYAKEFGSKFEDYRDINQKEKTDYIRNKINMLPIHEQMSKLDLNGTQLYLTLQVFTQVLCGMKIVFILK